MNSDHSGKILIVEDDYGTALLHRKCLERRGFAAICVATLVDAMQVLRHNKIQLIVLDHRLSGGATGVDFCERLKAEGCFVPVVIVTGYSKQTTAVDALRAGVRDYITKSPNYLDYLPEAVERVLRQVKVERQLSDSESRFAAIINSSQDAIVAIDDQHIIKLFNPAAEEIFRCPHANAIGNSVKQFLPDEVSFESGTPAFQSDSMVTANARAPRWRVDGTRADGTTVPLEVAVSHWVALDKTFSTLVIRDISRQKRAEAALQASEKRFRAFMDNGPAVAFIKDGEGRYLYINRKFTEVFKLTPQEVEGKTVAEIFPPAVAIQMAANDRAVAAASTVMRQAEMVPVNGEERFWMTFRFSFESSSGDPLIGGVAFDVTDQRRAEEVLRLREEQLRKTQKMDAVGTLAGGIAHEFNNILQAIQGHATFAIQGLRSDDSRFHDLEQLLKAVQHASLLTKQMLGFGRRQSLQLAKVNLNHVLQDLVKMIRPLVGSSVTIELALEEGIATVLADSDQLRQVLMNLSINARDAMPNGGTLLLGTEVRAIDGEQQPTHLELHGGRYVVVTVGDSGSGMTDSIKDHIFEPFFTTKEVGKGTGLGLAMVYGVVEQHAGAIDVKSEPGRGTTFEIYLSAVADDALFEKQPTAVSKGNRKHKELVS